ncbi:hypothetical protein ACOCEA_02845 [Maribacter sp. CXY002]|uniref:hypothetical protein n=1 Tax=Maribacter luteocoastalis TaxID=3407671 RepID=UPI003B66EC57
MSPMQPPITNSIFVNELIPQKWPFVMVDKLHHFSKNEIVSGLTITASNLFFSSNEFQEPGLIENMAQTVAMHKGYTYYLKNEAAPVGYIGAIKKAEIFTLPKLGDELVTTVTILHDIMGVTLVKAKIECGKTLIASSEIKTALAS